MAASVEDSLKLRIFHRTEDDFQREICVWKTARLGTSVKGKLFLEVFHATDISAIEIQGDEVTLPTALLLNVLVNGRFEEKVPIAVGPAPAGRVRFKDGGCFQFNVLLDPSDGSVFCVQTPEGGVSVPSIAKEKLQVPKLEIGMTRAEVEKKVQIDGGLSIPFRYERYVVLPFKPTKDGLVLKLNVAYKPAAMSDTTYYLGKWTTVQKQDPHDVLVRISPPYLELPICD